MYKQAFLRIINKVGSTWNNFWFAPTSTFPLAIFRILFGLLLIQYALLLIPDLFVWLGKEGIVSATSINSWQPYIRLNVLNLFPESNTWLIIVFSTFIVASCLFTFGLFTRLSIIIVFICLLSIHARNYLILNSGDKYMSMLCFWLIFSPAGASLSLDQWFAKHKNRDTSTPKLTEEKAPWAQRLMQINMCLLYAQTFFKKIVGQSWQNGTAVYFSSRMLEMRHYPLYYVFDHLWTCRLLTWATLAIELSLFTLIWFKPWRYYVLLLGMIMHLTIDWTMNIPQFEWLLITSYLLFIDPADLNKFIQTTYRCFLRKLIKVPQLEKALL